MRAEDAGARTWLYAALAGWAVCIWVLALFFVLLNLLVDILQTTLDPRIKRS